MSLIIGESGEGDGARGRETMEGAIDAFGCRECNVHLVVLLIDRIVLGLFPELGVAGDGYGMASENAGEARSGQVTPSTFHESGRPYGL
jgi:hypothetical protein